MSSHVMTQRFLIRSIWEVVAMWRSRSLITAFLRIPTADRLGGTYWQARFSCFNQGGVRD